MLSKTIEAHSVIDGLSGKVVKKTFAVQKMEANVEKINVNENHLQNPPTYGLDLGSYRL